MKELSAAALKAKFTEVAKEASESSLKVLPDNPGYLFQLKWEFTNTKKEPIRPMVIAHCEVMSGEYKGKVHRNYSVIDFDNTNGLKFLLILWRNLGVETDLIASFEDVKEVCEELNKKPVQATISLVSNSAGTNQNLRVISVYRDAPAETVKKGKEIPASTASTAPIPAPRAAEEEEEAEIIVGTRIRFVFKEVEQEGEITAFVNETKEEVPADSDKVFRIKAKSDLDGAIKTIKPESIKGVLAPKPVADPNEE